MPTKPPTWEDTVEDTPPKWEDTEDISPAAEPAGYELETPLPPPPPSELRPAGLREQIGLGPFGTGLGIGRGMEREIGRQFGGANVAPQDIMDTAFQFASVPPQLRKPIEKVTDVPINLLPPTVAGGVQGLRDVALGTPWAAGVVGLGKQLGTGLLALFAGDFIAQAPEAYREYKALRAQGRNQEAARLLVAELGTGALLGAGAKIHQDIRAGGKVDPARQALANDILELDAAVPGTLDAAKGMIQRQAPEAQRQAPATPVAPVAPPRREEPVPTPEPVPPPTAAAQAVAAAGQAPAAAAAPIPEARTLPAQAAAEASVRAAAIQKPAWVINLEAVEKAGNLNEAQAERLARWRAENEPAAPAAETTKAQFGDPLNPSNKFTAQPAKLEPDGGIFYAREHRMGELENRPGQSGFLVVDRDAVDEMAFEHDTYQFTPEDVKKTGMKFVSIPELDAAKGDFYEAIQNQKKGAPSAERIREEPGQVPPPGIEPQGGKKEGGYTVESGAPVEPESVGARGETPPPTLPNAPAREPVLTRDWDLFQENLNDDLDSFSAARTTGKVDYDLQDVAGRFVDYAKADKSGKPLDKLVSEFAKNDDASQSQIRKLGASVKNVLASEAKPPPKESLTVEPPSKTAVGKGEVTDVLASLNEDNPSGAVDALRGMKFADAKELLFRRLGIVDPRLDTSSKKNLIASFEKVAPEYTKSARQEKAKASRIRTLEREIQERTENLARHDQVVAEGGPDYAGLEVGVTREQAAQKIKDLQAELDKLKPTPPPAAETGEKTPMRPGPGAATGGAVEDPIQTLNEQIAALPRSDARTRVSMAERMADRLAAGKDLAHRATLRAQAVTQSLAQTFRGVRTPTELGNRVGEVDYLLQKAAALSRENARVLERSIPDLATRQGLWIWADAHGNEAAIRDAILKLPRETKPAVRRALQASLKLTDKEKAWLPFVREYYDKKAQVAEQMGVLNSVLEDYYTHVWRVKDNMPAKLQAAFNSGKIKEYWQFSRERKLPDILTGIVDPTIVGRRRYVDPETGVETIVESGKRLEPILDPAKIIPHYNYTLDRAIASRAFMKAVSEMKTSTGEPALAPKGVAENRVFNQWAVVNNETGRADPFVQGVFETEAEANAALAGREGYHIEQRPNEYLFIKSHVTPEQIAKYKPIDHPSMRKWQWAGTDGNKTVLYEGELLAHPEVHERLARMMDRSRLTPSPLTRAVLRYSAETKAAKLGMLSSFHLIHVGKHAIFHLTNPFRAAMDSMRSLGGKGIDWESPEVRQAIEKGHLNLAADPGDVAAMSEGAGGAGNLIIHKFPLVGPLSKAFSEWMFQDFIPQLKLQTYRNALHRNLKMYGPQATPTGRVLARAGVLGLPVGRLTPDEVAARTGDAVNAAYGELNKLWLGAHGRNPATQRALRMIFLAPDFGEARLRFVGKAATAFGNEERLALIMNALMVYSAARVANMLISGNPHNDDARHLFDVKVGDHWLTMRSVLVDVEHAMTNFIQFARIRMNPALVTPLLDLFTGTNWKGQKRNGWQWVKDRMAAYVPAQAQSLTEDNKHLWESWLASMGINPKRADAVAEIHERARRFRDQRGIVSPVDIAVSSEGNPYREARIALEFDDPWRFWRAMQQQVQRLDATNTKQPLKVIEGAFARYYAMPFSGKKSLEPEFVASLAPRDRTIYREAQQRQKETYAKFKDWWRDHKSYLGQ